MTPNVPFTQLAALLGLKTFWWHDLRVTFCTRLALARYEALTIMSLMGHKDFKTTAPFSFNVTCDQLILSTNWHK